MPSLEHEGLVALFENRPTLATELIAQTPGVHVPRFTEARIESGSLTQVDPAAFQADAVVVHRDGEVPVLAVIVEVQRQIDSDKPYRWSVDSAAVFDRYRSPTRLLLVTPDRKVSRWARRPIEVSVGWPWRPLVLGPDNFPILTDEDEARRNPERTILSFLAHARSVDPETGVRLSYAAKLACEAAGPRHGALYFQAVDSLLEDTWGVLLEAFMETKGVQIKRGYFGSRFFEEGRREGRQEGRQEGKREGLTAAVRSALEARFGPLPDWVQGQLETVELSRLEQILRQAVTAESLEAALR